MILDLCGVPLKLINLMSELYTGTGSAVRNGDTISDISSCYWSSSGVCTGPHTFQHLYGVDSGEDVRSSCGASFGNLKISDLDFANNAVIFAETLYIYPFGGPRGAK